MVAVPVPAPVTIPVVPTLATEVLVLLHVPPLVASVKVVVEPTHIEADVGETAATPLVNEKLVDGLPFTITWSE